MKWFLVSYQYQIFLAQISAHTYCSSQRVWLSDQFPPLFFAIEKKSLQLFEASQNPQQSNFRLLRILGGIKKLQTFFSIAKKLGETGPIAKPSEMSNMYALKSGQEKFGTDSSQGTISF